ncbi:uncharacterized protein LY79DRAFT_678835 [Colletotrichum navitas]|uniref:Uncharacterized protein n=1 Tax=Colletotrichum navitas TaxID=681940 RepID=A0AAD8Q6X3_9PEZI|nr:uncharacterized protein LY79DRAFT_678835 [Colletotrichum navitas]KAK1596277.1 hypothetical protein LY79DRAFT_678835 [Colletotrichum navitas]
MTHRPPTAQEFVPVGHLSLDGNLEINTKLELPANEVIWALQADGLGRFAMRRLKALAAGDSSQARVLALNTPLKKFHLAPEFIEITYTHVAEGLQRCYVLLRGGIYVIFHHDDEGYLTSRQVHKLLLALMTKDA